MQISFPIELLQEGNFVIGPNARAKVQILKDLTIDYFLGGSAAISVKLYICTCVYVLIHTYVRTHLLLYVFVTVFSWEKY